MFIKKLIVLILIICFLISMVGCGGVPTTPPISSESELVLVQVTDTKSNLISVAGKENEDAIAFFGEKDIEGNPISITGAVYVSEQGGSFGIDAGIDGLPTYLIDSEGNKVIFENYTNSTVDISIYDSNGGLIQETITINIDSADLLELKQLYISFYSQQKGGEEQVATGLRWGAKVLPWIGCAISVGGTVVYFPLILLAAKACAGPIAKEILVAIVNDEEFTKVATVATGTAACGTADPFGCFSFLSNIIADEIDNHAPIISSLTANPSSININETTVITCTASDEDTFDFNMDLTYTWTKTDGTFEGSTSGSTIIWKAPSTKGNYTVTCEVSDGEASDSEQVIISVGDVNHPPVITSFAVTSATKGQPYSYDVNATDSDGDIPVYSLTTKPSGMSINSSTGLITWTPTVSGNYNVTVKVFDGELFDTQSFTVKVEENGTTNQPPTLTLVGSGGVSPGSGTPSTTFAYSVYYSDPEGASPTVKNVYIDGSSHTMSGSGSGSTYTYQISGLSAGTHTYSFQFSDGTTTVNLPTSGTYAAPTVTSTVNQSPTLTLVGSGGVSPGSGTPSTTFAYSFYYSDPEGASPTVKNVYIDGSSHTMSGSGSGSTYTYQISGLSAGTHTYSFQFSDGTYTVNLPSSGTYAAPTVTSTVNQNVTLTLYICENSTSGPLLSGVSIGIVDGGGNSFGQTTNNSGYVTITGTPGTWNFSAMKSGYDTNNWSQSITTNCTKYGYIVKSATPVGAIDVFATLDGSYWIGSLSYSLTGPSSSSGSTVSAVLSNKPVGSYSIAFNSGGPSNASLSSITPSSTQTLSTGGIINFTFNFTGSTLLSPTGFLVSSYWNTVTGFPSMNLSWNAVSGATGYEMWVRPSGGSYAYLGPRDAPYVTFNSNSLPGGARYVSGTTYYFKIRTVTASGTSDFTSEVSCVAAASPSLGQVQLSGPSNGATLPPMSVVFWWNPVSNATKYQFILYNQQGQVALDTTNSSTSTFVALGTEETITWKVRAGDNSGNWGAWSSTWSLTIKTLT